MSGIANAARESRAARTGALLALCFALMLGCAKPTQNSEPKTSSEVKSPAIPEATFGHKSLSENRLGEGDGPILLPGHLKIGTVPAGSRIGSKSRKPESETETSAPPEPAKTAEEPAPARRLIVFTPRVPLIVHVELYVAGQPQQAAIDRVFEKAMQAALDRDKGRSTWAALVASPKFASGLLGNQPFKTTADHRRIVQEYDFDRDGRVSHEELAAFLSQNNEGGRPFAVESSDGYGQDDQDYPTLFVLLDQDEDGRLSSEELAGAFAKLRSRDADDNDTLSEAELRPPAARMNMMMQTGRDTQPQRAFELTKLKLDSIYYRLGELYDAGEGLNAKSLSLTPGLLHELDANQNGVFDSSEIKKLLDVRPDLVLKVDFAPSSDPERALVEIKELGDDLQAADSRAETEAGGVRLALPGATLDVMAKDMTPRADSADQLSTRFKALDSDGSGSLDLSELAAFGAELASTFTELDADKDGKLSLDEVKQLLSGENKYAALQVQVRMSEIDDPIFNWLDANHDGRLTGREMAAAKGRLAELDQDGDGTITTGEIPRRISLIFVRGMRQRDAMPYGAMAGQARQGEGPDWMQAMDQNGDGELSHREFLGTAEQFAGMDLNSDGFIDGREARDLAESARQSPASAEAATP